MSHFKKALFSLVFLWFAAPVLADTSEFDDLVAAYEALSDRYSSETVEIDGRDIQTGWPDIRPETQAEWLNEAEALLERVRSVDAADLGEDDALSLEILEVILDGEVARGAFDEARLPFTGDWGFHSSITFDVSSETISSAEAADVIIARIDAIPAYLKAQEANMRRGLESGFVSYSDPLDTVIEQLEELVADDPEDSPLYMPFTHLPNHLSEEEKADIRERGKAAVAEALAGFDETLTFLKDDYAPQTRDAAGIVDLPDARAYYQALVTYHTTLPELTPEDVHSIGQAEVKRIRGEMEAIIEEVGFEGSFKEFQHFLRTDPQFYAQTPEELLEEAARLAKTLDYQMPKYFGHLPRLPYGVEPVPDHIAPGYTTGRYISGDLSRGRAGAYWVNTFALDQRPLYELPALTAHEAVPGHHNQIAIAQELRDVPKFRKSYYATAFGEGWGLYSETLAGEMGLYDDPYKRFGKLSYEMWRACRLVSDTGLHWYGWTREEAEVCFLENSALSPLNIKTEVTRYIGWPGQALGYKIGELKILELRQRAEDALGPDFDIRNFHDLILGKGALPLAVLERRVDEWIEDKTSE